VFVFQVLAGEVQGSQSVEKTAMLENAKEGIAPFAVSAKRQIGEDAPSIMRIA
jgi:hypothetical protein